MALDLELGTLNITNETFQLFRQQLAEGETIHLDKLVNEAIQQTYSWLYKEYMNLFLYLILYLTLYIISKKIFDITILKIPGSKHIEEEEIKLFLYLSHFFRFLLYAKILHIGFWLLLG